MTNNISKYRPIDAQISEVVRKHQDNPEAILEVLTEIQEKRGNLEADTITDVGRSMHIPPASTYGVASFYSMLNLKEKVEHRIRVCDGPVCWLCGVE